MLSERWGEKAELMRNSGKDKLYIVAVPKSRTEESGTQYSPLVTPRRCCLCKRRLSSTGEPIKPKHRHLANMFCGWGVVAEARIVWF